MTGGVDGVLDVIGAVLVLLGAVLCLTAAIGLLRLPDVLSRMHAATKPQTLGLLFVLTGIGFTLRQPAVIALLVLVGLLQLFTAPVAAHMVARTAYRTHQLDDDLLVTDELSDDLSDAGFELVTPDDEDTADNGGRAAT
ncbi:monovalent cation/H(+) antiporter subunit G [Microlunatus parietis]|uniref:Multicomponent Na+:H+ antiporter subunit G n=1 Tax=Microlunatus parietis TaxID=682979 RepID=A0A7Y9LE92_9ACTN|nr:monovalent cation/H(+) antiporter subunit G [Microlunatus parietis]NYE74702.1 multicomponent Na+:H+ antiporter subunit G [Microlunatus parietis]